MTRASRVIREDLAAAEQLRRDLRDHIASASAEELDALILALTESLALRSGAYATHARIAMAGVVGALDRALGRRPRGYA